MNLFQSGNFTLSSGLSSKHKIDCDALTDGDIDTLAAMIRCAVGPFSAAVGVPRGGLRLAEALRPFADSECHTLLIVDDVLSTGGSIKRFAAEHCPDDGCATVIGAVIFARGRCPAWVTPLFQTPECLWLTKAIRDIIAAK